MQKLMISKYLKYKINNQHVLLNKKPKAKDQ